MWDIIGAAAVHGAQALLNKKASDKAATAAKDAESFNAAKQEEFAKHGIRWKVEDAREAGIHPLVALGAPTASFTPSSIGSTGPDYSMGNAVAGMGQDISRAISSTQTAPERKLSSLQIQSAELDLQGKALDNQIKNSQLQKMNQVGPAFPGSSSFISGQGNSGIKVMEKPMERTMSLGGMPHAEPGSLPQVGWMNLPNGGLVPVPSKDVKERIEDNMPQEWAHYARNNVLPNFGGSSSKPPRSALPKGAQDWEWSFMDQAWMPTRSKSSSPWEKAQRWYDNNLRYPKKGN